MITCTLFSATFICMKCGIQFTYVYYSDIEIRTRSWDGIFQCRICTMNKFKMVNSYIVVQNVDMFLNTKKYDTIVVTE